MAQRQWRSDDTDKWIYGFGDGSAGTSYAVPANEGCSGTSGTKSLTLAAAGSFSNGDLVLIHQSRGTGAGAWELNKIASGAGGTSLTMVHDLMNTYTDSGASQAQIIELNQYENLTTGSITGPSWNGSKGGIVAFLDKGTTTVDGNLYIKGVAGIGPYVNTELIAGATGGGFYGGNGDSEGASVSNATSGEGYGAARTNGLNPNTSGGGMLESAPGAGGGNGAAGSNGQTGTTTGGLASGNANLTSLTFGGGGGGGCGTWTDTSAGSGGSGGGAVFIFSKNLVITGTVDVSGGAGGAGGSTNDGQVGGGGGAGGSVLVKSETATLGTNKILATGGAGGTSGGGRAGGAGAVGRIHIDYSSSYTGTTTPTIDATLDTTIRQTIAGGGFLFNLI